MKVLVNARLSEEQLQSLRQLSPELQVVRELDPEKAREHMRDTDILLSFQLPGPLAEARSLKWIQLISAGSEHLFEAGIASTDIVVTNVSGIHRTAIGEYVLCTMVMLARQIPLILRESQGRQWKPSRLRTYYGEELRGKTLGILGLGSIGQEIARIGRCLGMQVLGLRRSGGDGLEKGIADEVFGPEGLSELLPRCDFLVVVLPMTPKTRKLVGERELRAMKRSSYLIDVARGGIVDEAALASALREGWIAGAAMDVFEEEPLPQQSELWDLPNLIITPHMAGGTLPYVDRATEIFRENLRRYLAGEPMINVVDKDQGY